MRLEQIPLILLAGGKSSRLGSPKGLLKVHDRLWLEAQCESFRRIGGRIILLILGFDREYYLHTLGLDQENPELPIEYAGCTVFVLRNMLPELGPFTSVQCACNWMVSHPHYPAAFCLSIDTPVPSETVMSGLADQLEVGTSVVQPRMNSYNGHPLLLSRHFLLELLSLDPTSADSRLDIQVRYSRGRGEVRSLQVDDPCIHLNLNTPDAWQSYIGTLSRNTDNAERTPENQHSIIDDKH